MFPREAARSVAAQLILGLSYLHANGVFHGGTRVDLHMQNFLLRTSVFDGLSTVGLYERYGKPYKVPVRRLDGQPPEPHAPRHAIFPMALDMPADAVNDPEVIISDYGTSSIMSQNPSPTLYTPTLYAPAEEFFNETITKPTAADVWTLGVNLYEILGERPLFETFAWDPDDIVGEMINTLGKPPARWWNSWANRPEFFEADGSWVPDFQRINTPVFRRLHQRLWDMGRGETPETCEWGVAGGEMRALEELLRAMMAFEPAERPTAEQLLASEYMVQWALPAWERQRNRERDSRVVEQ